jgi:iron complex transport system substrate-binding protein
MVPRPRGTNLKRREPGAGLGDRLVAVTFECAAAVRSRCSVVVVDTALPAGLGPSEIDT